MGRISRGKTKRILLSLLLCGCISSSAYAYEYDYTWGEDSEGNREEHMKENEEDTDSTELKIVWDDYTTEGAVTTSGSTDTYTYKDAEGNEVNKSYKYTTVDLSNIGTTSVTVKTELGEATTKVDTVNVTLWITKAEEEAGDTEGTVPFNIYCDDEAYGDGMYISSSRTESITGYFDKDSVLTGRGDGFDGYAVTVTGAIEVEGISSAIFAGIENVSAALYFRGGATVNEISGSYFMDNSNSGGSGLSGGAIYNYGASIKKIENSYFVSNTVKEATVGKGNGAAISNNSSASYASAIDEITGSCFVGNIADYAGGAIYSHGDGTNDATIGTISYSTFVANEAQYGGAISNNSGSSIESISNSYFVDNEAGVNGGAIYNSGGTIGEITKSNFVGNISSSDTEQQSISANGHGGAIYNGGTIEKITDSTFVENFAPNGAAIYITADGIIGEISGSYFVENIGYSAGAIRNEEGVIGIIDGTGTDGDTGGIKDSYFIRNSTTSTTDEYGGGTETFWGYGGAIRNFGTITGITGSYFVENKCTADASYADQLKEHGTYGGAIFNQSYIGMAEVDGEVVEVGDGIQNTVFQNNEATRGGAIYNGSLRSGGETVTDGDYSSIISSIKGCTFYGNVGVLYGGAIYNYADGAILDIDGNSFLYNEAQGGNGGAIENAESYAMIENITNNYFYKNTVDTSNHGGGAIYTEGIISTIEGNAFVENESGNFGGAIYNNGGTIGGTFEIDDEEGHEILEGSGSSISGNYFQENKSTRGGAIYTTTTRSLDDDNNETLSYSTDYKGYGSIMSITGNTFVNNTANAFGGAIYSYHGSDVGEISKNYFEGNESHGGNGGAVENAEYDTSIGTMDGNVFINNKATAGNGGAIYNQGSIGIDRDNDDAVVGGILNSTFTGNEALSGGAIYNNYGTGTVAVNLYDDETDPDHTSPTETSLTFAGSGKIGSITDCDFKGNKATDGSGGAIYNNGSYTFTNMEGEEETQVCLIDSITGSTFTGNSAVSESGEAAGGAVYNIGTINTFSVKDLTGNHAEGATGAMGGAIYDGGASVITVTGDVTDNYVTASSGDALGGAIYAGEGTVVTLSGNITGNSATGATAKGGAIYNAGEVNINVENKDAVISGNKAVSGGTEEANVLYGEADSVTNFSLTDATLRVDDSINGETGFEVNISGNGIDATTFYMYNDINDSNLSIGGTTLNTMNGEAHTYNVNQFTVSGDFNMQADIDLGKETMDRFVTNGNSYGEAQGTLNVSALNVVSDTGKTRVGVYFAEPGLKEDVTSSVSDVTGPINTYSVSYDKNYDGSWGDDGGYFVFDKTGTNPAAMIPPVAMIGAYNAMNMMFEYCFEHSDYFMKLPSETRLAIREKAKAAKAEKLALKNGTTVEEEAKKIDDARAEELASREGDKFYDHENVLPVYDQHELTRPGAWVKTFATKESVPFTGKFTANDKYYGALIGVDTDFREDNKGWGNVFTGYAGYQGIHQSFSGGSIRQDGGMLGATETFYKKNFYTAWTIAAASTRAKARNMYGRESSRLYTYGIATKSGWNLEYDGGKYIVLPTFMASYTTVDMRDYTNASGLRVNADDMRAVQLSPNVKWIRNYSNGWQPYLTAGEVWTVGQKSRVRVNGTELDKLHLRPYTEYGIGVQKRWAHDYDGYAEFLGHAGGRRGFLAKLGFRWTFN